MRAKLIQGQTTRSRWLCSICCSFVGRTPALAAVLLCIQRHTLYGAGSPSSFATAGPEHAVSHAIRAAPPAWHMNICLTNLACMARAHVRAAPAMQWKAYPSGETHSCAPTHHPPGHAAGPRHPSALVIITAQRGRSCRGCTDPETSCSARGPGWAAAGAPAGPPSLRGSASCCPPARHPPRGPPRSGRRTAAT